MVERPILFSAPMVRAILAGTKTQTRRVVKPQPTGFIGGPGVTMPDGSPSPLIPMNDTVAPFGRQIGCPYGQPGDQLWVREAWSTHACFDNLPPRDCPKSIHYTADGPIQTGKGRPSIHMPRWASRISLVITGVRVERLGEISAADAKAEGIEGQTETGPWRNYMRDGYWFPEGKNTAPQLSFASLWHAINGPESWAANPWVWVVEFTHTKPTEGPK